MHMIGALAFQLRHCLKTVSTALGTNIILFSDEGALRIKDTKTSIKEKGIWDKMAT